MSTEKTPVIYLNGEKRSKSVLFGAPADITTHEIVSFLKKYESGSVKEYKLDEEVEAQAE